MKSFLPSSKGLYNSEFEHDACGVAFVADMHGRQSHEIVQQGIEALLNLEHRGAYGAEDNTGDGAGILIQLPDAFMRKVVDFDLPAPGAYATGLVFLPAEEKDYHQALKDIKDIASEEGLVILGWREVPIDDSGLGSIARSSQPRISQLFVEAKGLSGMDIERKVFLFRKRTEIQLEDVYFPSLSSKTFVYKGMLTTPQLTEFYPDLLDPELKSALALVHSRFSTNTFPAWPLAHPYRYIAHNGEINTLKGNRNKMRAREALLKTDLLEGDLDRIFPICTPNSSDSVSFDEVLELLYMGGRSLPHAVLMMVPEAWENNPEMDAARRAFYEFHASMMEPWDGPASIAFTDGTVIGAVLDRNGLRPSRYWVTSDGLVVMASESGVLEIDPEQVVQKGRLQPGRMFLVDTEQGRIISDSEIKSSLANAHPYSDWLDQNLIREDDLPAYKVTTPKHSSVVLHQNTFGYTQEEIAVLISPMAQQGAEAIGSMGNDASLAVLSNRPRLLFDYFSQLFAQVTNPPLDAIREELVTSLFTLLGPERNLFDPTPQSCHQILLSSPVISNSTLAKFVHINQKGETPGFTPFVIEGIYKVEGGEQALFQAIENVRTKVSQAIEKGANIIVLSDRNSSKEMAPIPSLLLVSAVHHHLVRQKTRTQVALIAESGDAREIHHMALLLGFGASAVNPYLAFETISDLIETGSLKDISEQKAIDNFIKASNKGILKVMSKMGISTVSSYIGAQVFEAIGLSQDFVDNYFTSTISRLGGIGLSEISKEIEKRHKRAYLDRPTELAHRSLDTGGEYKWRREGEYHLFNPETVFKLQHSTRTKQYDIFKEYSHHIDEQAQHLATLRGLFEFDLSDRTPIDIEEVEPISEIVKRFATGAMSYGSISAEAHQTLAIAMNRLGAKSNTGEGGEDAERFLPDPNGDSKRSAIKQVASGRFGVTSEYLVNADDIQIKMAQGAKPGEGGQLPGHKVYPWIAKTRYSTPGVGLISPPPHHDIYSIEDLAQLIHDLKNSNSSARIHVKLVSEIGVGTIAAGVAKAHADVVLISGHDGGTGAAPLTSLKHAGTPWELGLAETQQTLLLNGLRDRIVVQVDGQIKTGRDVIVAALLGAEEFGFATAPLIVSGCIMMRACHLDTCPVGIATQNPELRKKFTGTPEFVVTFFEFIAQEVREYLASLGFRSIQEAIGHAEVLKTNKAIQHWKASGMDLSHILNMPQPWQGQSRFQTKQQDHGLDKALDLELIELAKPALEDAKPVQGEFKIRNVNRTVGTMLGSELTRRYGRAGLPDDTIQLNFFGSAGQSFGAFLPQGITMRLEGDANDYVGKGLSGGHLSVYPSSKSPFDPSNNVIAGNVILYGATSGELFLRGLVGERFAVRNSGAVAVVEGVGDHACEYMTGGKVVILGPTGRNVAAGMSGGVAYIYDPDANLAYNINNEMVDLDPLDDEDQKWLEEIIRRHQIETSSTIAQKLLRDWQNQVEQFIKIMPRDYKKIIQSLDNSKLEQNKENLSAMAGTNG